ncbi:short-chain dehydrogenase/reductase SDR [Halococcus hamelinensis 100A6]|uniref:Short-chain dehydrogenase/reductase SDR n=2 Tax=Halococcus hamelinensis TaxID=332168 RepID=M0M9Q1_9EURY|nr:glucose 1-dehydrogenase [Halococcus hamelinensis]EMA42058.1 short-chain dehydrogenase/reductase SDR [Halococcus hamelinensis 100A6]
MDSKSAIVTGASSGIGRATARRFAEEGASVVVADLVEEGGNDTVDIIEDEGGEAMFVQTDVTNDDDVSKMVDAAVENYGSLDVVHNNAGILTGFDPLTDLDESDWDALLNVNLKGVWLGLKHEIPAMLEDGGGAIVNTASEAGLVGFPGIANYVASKHGVIGLTRAAGLEYAEDGIRVNAVCPGPIETPMTDDPSVDSKEVVEYTPMRRMGQPEEVANAVVWLCSDEASYVTAHPLSVDGGRVAQ